MIKIINYKNGDSLKPILARSQFSYDNINKKVKAILEDVKKNGDKALIKYNKEFDNADTKTLEVSKKEIDSAYNRIDNKFKKTLNLAYKNIEKFHKKQIRNGFITNEENGIVMGQIINPIEKVGVYIPGGTAIYPSTVLMNVIPAKVAKVPEIILVSPPNKNGKISDIILAAAKISGVDRVFKIGGAQAIAALSYGTESVPKVYKIVGPGNIYVATAKRLVYGEISIDMFAGPSEILIIADENANPIHIAADMLAQAEHDKLASSVLITTSENIASKVKEELYKQLKNLIRKEIAEESIKNNGKIIIGYTKGKPQYIKNISNDLIIKSRVVVVNRITGSSKDINIKAAIVNEKEFLCENHVNVIYMSKNANCNYSLEDIFKALQDKTNIKVMRLISGNTQISKTELERLLPIIKK